MPRRRSGGWVLARSVGVLRRAPVTVGVVAVLWGLGAATGSLLAGPGPGLRATVGVGVSTLAGGRWWTLLSSGLWCAGLLSYLVTAVLLLVVVAPVEARLGSARTAALLVVTQIVGAGIGIALVALAGVGGDGWAQRVAGHVALGPSGAVFGVALGATAGIGVLWRRRLRLLLLGGLVMTVVYAGSLPDVLRLVAGVVGLGWGALTLSRSRRRSRRAAPAATGPETRVLLALVVAASAVGPVLASVSGTALGPLSVLRFLVLATPPDSAAVAAVCADPSVARDCPDLLLRLRLGGLGPAVLTVLPVVVLLVLADGLRRGRRVAWWGALVLNLLFAGLGTGLAVLTALVPAERLVTFGVAGRDAGFPASVAAAAAQPLAVAALLLLTRHRFTVAAPWPATRRALATVGIALATAATLYVVGGWVLRAEFAPAPGWAELWADLPTRLLPPGYLGQTEISFLPTTPLATLLYEWTGIVVWGVALGATWRLLRQPPSVPGDAAAARAVLRTYGGSSLSYLSTWPGHRYWIDPAGRAVVAYRVIGGVAVSTGEPFGAVEARLPAVAGFARFCAEHAWSPCLYGVGAQVKAHTESLGWSGVQVAEDTVVALPELAFTGRRWQDVRSARNHAGKAGITAEWITFGSAPLVLRDQIRAISEEWVAERGLPEMGFTLGGLEELDDPEVRCLIAVDADRTVHGVTSWLPCYAERAEDHAVAGWTLDFMRRREGGFRPVMELLIAEAALRFQAEGAGFISLSGAPLARVDRGAPVDPLQRVADRLGELLEPVYGFRSLLAFKAKFQPEYRPLYVAYPDPAALPAVAAAITRAYLPDLTPTGALAVLRRLRRSRPTPPSPAPRDVPPAPPPTSPTVAAGEGHERR